VTHGPFLHCSVDPPSATGCSGQSPSFSFRITPCFHGAHPVAGSPPLPDQRSPSSPSDGPFFFSFSALSRSFPAFVSDSFISQRSFFHHTSTLAAAILVQWSSASPPPPTTDPSPRLLPVRGLCHSQSPSPPETLLLTHASLPHSLSRHGSFFVRARDLAFAFLRTEACAWRARMVFNVSQARSFLRPLR